MFQIFSPVIAQVQHSCCRWTTKVVKSKYSSIHFLQFYWDIYLAFKQESTVLSAVTSLSNCDDAYVTVLFSFQVIKNPVSDHLPLGCKKYGTSFHVEKVTNPRDIVPEKEPVVIVIGALSHGSVSHSEFREFFFFILLINTYSIMSYFISI